MIKDDFRAARSVMIPRETRGERAHALAWRQTPEKCRGLADNEMRASEQAPNLLARTRR